MAGVEFAQENPLGSDEAADVISDDPESTPLLERRVADLEARLAKHEQVLGTGGSAQSTIRGVLAHLGKTPTNWHQAVVFFLGSRADEDAEIRRVKAPAMFFAGLVLILFQTVTTIGVLTGAFGSPCAHSDMCERGAFCLVGGSGRCAACGAKPPLKPNVTACDWTSSTLRVGRAESRGMCHVPFAPDTVLQLCADPVELPGWDIDFDGNVKVDTVREWCSACVIDHATGTYDEFTDADRVADNIFAMGVFDKGAYVFATYVVALTITAEIKDIELCQFAIERAQEDLSIGWRVALILGCNVRRFVFCPALLACVAMLVLTRGADALSISFNTIAVLFLCEVDNVSYYIGLGEHLRARVEDVGRIDLSEAQQQRLTRTKAVHVPIIMVGLLVPIGSMSMWSCILIGSFTIGISLGISTLLASPSEQPPPKLLAEVAIGAGKSFLGFVCYFIIFAATFTLG